MNKHFCKRQMMALILTGILTFHSSGILPVYADNGQNAKSILAASETAISTVQEDSKLVIGQIYHGFKLESKEFSKDMNAQMYTFCHVKTGGMLVYMANDDINKWFSTAFKTPAVDQTGVNHIIEHSILEGSAKYKVKSPYKEMGKRSVNTYMNAFTGTDVTYFPFASENDKDFKNLMGVYMDAMFAPNVIQNANILRQEGWRYEVDKTSGAFNYNGVVFSEMKGLASDPYTTVYNKMASTLYPDTKYRFDSGGIPESIVDLTHQQLVATYKNYYHPSNACITLYGKMNILEHLKFINDDYYSKFSRGPAIVDDKIQETFKQDQIGHFSYPGSKGQTADEDSILTWSVKIDNASPKDLLGLAIIADLLADPKYSSVYKKMATEADENLYVKLDRDFYQPMFSFILEGVDDDQLEELDEAIDAALNRMVDNGINKEKLVSLLNQYELSCMYALTSADRGQTAVETTGEDFVRYDDPTRRFNETELLNQIKTEEINGKYFENLVQTYLLDNTHVSQNIFIPDPDFIKKLQIRLDQKLKLRTERMPKKVQAQLKAEAADFEKWQQAPNDPASVNALPKLTINDIDTLVKDYQMMVEEKASGKLVKHVVDANGLSQVNMMFDLSVLTEEELKYLDLFNAVISTAGTKSYRAASLLNLEDQYTSGLYFTHVFMDDYKHADKYNAFYVVGTSFMKGNEETVFKIFKEIMTAANIKNKNLVALRLKEQVEAIKDEKAYATPKFADVKLGESLSAAGKLRAMRYGESYEMLKKANADFDANYATIQANLDSIYKKLFSQHNMLMSVSSDEVGLSKIGEKANVLMGFLGGTKNSSNAWQAVPKAQKTALVFPSEMQYIELGFNLGQLGEKVSGKDLVFAELISEGYMYEKIRLKGGAYGGSLSIDRNGNVQFSTYRDPNLKTSIEAIHQLTTYLKTVKLTQAELDNAIIAVAGRIGQESDIFEKTYSDDVLLYTQFSKEDQERFVKEILETKISDLPAFASKMEKGLSNASLVVAGSESEIEKCRAMFDQIIQVTDQQ